MTVYIRFKGRDTWHFHTKCSHVVRASAKDNAITGSDVRYNKPRSGELCNECLAKTKKDKKK